MSQWIVKRTDTFLKHLKKHKHHHDLLVELDKKIQRFTEDPCRIGGELAGPLHGKKSTCLVGKFRLIFQIEDKEKVVYLLAIGHRGNIYD